MLASPGLVYSPNSINSLGSVSALSTRSSQAFVFPTTHPSVHQSTLASQRSGSPSVGEFGTLTRGPGQGVRSDSFSTMSTHNFGGTGYGNGNGRSTSPSQSSSASALMHPIHIRGDSSTPTDVLRAQGSRSSLYLLAQAQAQAQAHASASGHQGYRGSGGSNLASMSSMPSYQTQTQQHQLPASASASSRASLQPPPHRSNNRRSTGAPHSRFSRIDIVTPKPLAPPPGTVVPLDKSTLAFSSLSGIGKDMSMGSILAASGSNGDLRQQQQQQQRHAQRQSRQQQPSISEDVAVAGSDSGLRAVSPTTSGHASSENVDQESMGASNWFNGTPSDSDSNEHGSTRAGQGLASTSDSNASASANSSAPSLPGVVVPAATSEHATVVPYVALRARLNKASASASAGLASDPNTANTLHQSPLDKLKDELEGEARRVRSRSSVGSAA